MRRGGRGEGEEEGEKVRKRVKKRVRKRVRRRGEGRICNCPLTVSWCKQQLQLTWKL